MAPTISPQPTVASMKNMEKKTKKEKGKNIFGRGSTKDKGKNKDMGKKKKDSEGNTPTPNNIGAIWALLTGKNPRDHRDGGDEQIFRPLVQGRKHHFALEQWYRDYLEMNKEE
jgi:hypothetical protein